MATNVELYEALKPSIGTEAAKMIAEVVPPTRELATRADVESARYATSADIASVRTELKDEIASVRTELKDEITSVRTELKDEIASLCVEMHAGTVLTIKWVVGAMIPLYVGTFGGLLAAVLKA